MKSRIHLSEHFTYSKLLRFTLPTIVMNIFLSLYIMVDGYFVANFVGKTEFAAINLIMPVLGILGTIGYMFGVGGSALIAKALGEKNRDQANRLFSLIVLVSAGLGVLMMVAGFIFMRPITSLLGAEGQLLEDSVQYGRIFILALPAWILLYEFQLFFVTAEKPRLGLVITVLAGLSNIAFDALFIIGFKWGLAGAAAASALSQIVGGMFPVIYFMRKNDSLLRLVKPSWEGKAIVKSMTNGSSEFMADAAWSIVAIIYNMQLLKYAGEDGVVIYGLLMYVSLIFSVAYLFSGIAIFSSAFFTALNNGQVSALISFLRTFVFELGAVLLLPMLLGVEGIWFSIVFAELMAAVVGSIFMVALRKKYQY